MRLTKDYSTIVYEEIIVDSGNRIAYNGLHFDTSKKNIYVMTTRKVVMAINISQLLFENLFKWSQIKRNLDLKQFGASTLKSASLNTL